MARFNQDCAFGQTNIDDGMAVRVTKNRLRFPLQRILSYTTTYTTLPLQTSSAVRSKCVYYENVVWGILNPLSLVTMLAGI
jgi:hypothetical protein